MDFNDFKEKFVDLFDDLDANDITSETRFRDLSDWSSLIALSLMAMVDEEYDVDLDGDQIRGYETLGEIYNHILKEMN